MRQNMSLTMHVCNMLHVHLHVEEASVCLEKKDSVLPMDLTPNTLSNLTFTMLYVQHHIVVYSIGLWGP